MINLYKFELYSTYILDSKSINEGVIPEQLFNPFCHNGKRSHNTTYIPIPKNVTVYDAGDDYWEINIEEIIESKKSSGLTFEDKIYIHPDCSIPRSNVAAKYTKVLKADNADVCIIPSSDKVYVEPIAAFINKEKAKVYIISPTRSWNNKGKRIYNKAYTCADHKLGTSFATIYPNLVNAPFNTDYYVYGDDNQDTYTFDNYGDLLTSTLIYYGYAYGASKRNVGWVSDLLYNKIHDIVLEREILSTLGDASNQFTKELYDSLYDMLTSTDDAVVSLGLKTLSELDYHKYCNTAKHLLCVTFKGWRRNAARTNTSVKYMFDYLDINSTYPKEHFTPIITMEDFNLIKEYVEKEIKEGVDSLNKRLNSSFPFSNVKILLDYKINPLIEFNQINTKE